RSTSRAVRSVGHCIHQRYARTHTCLLHRSCRTDLPPGCADGKPAQPTRVAVSVNVLAISGSLQENSSNSALLRAVSACASDIDVIVWDELGALPLFRPGDDGDVHVASLRHGIAEADAVLIATPEYAGGMPGALKNALDWLVGSGELYDKPVVIMSAAPSL